MTSNYDKLARDWIALNEIGSGRPESAHLDWAFNAMCDLAFKSPDECWDVILAILKMDQSDNIMAKLAAGPLEELLVYHGSKVIDRIEQLARQDDEFRKLLGGVWKNSIPDEVWIRLQAVSGPKF